MKKKFFVAGESNEKTAKELPCIEFKLVLMYRLYLQVHLGILVQRYSPNIP